MTWSAADLAAVLARGDCRLVPDQAAPALPAATPEKVLLGQVLTLARQYGWRCYHTHRSDKSPAGYPDLCLTKPGRLIFAEVKSQTGKLTHEQHIWLDMLQQSVPGVEVYLWRPSDYPTIVQLLTKKGDTP